MPPIRHWSTWGSCTVYAITRNTLLIYPDANLFDSPIAVLGNGLDWSLRERARVQSTGGNIRPFRSCFPKRALKHSTKVTTNRVPYRVDGELGRFDFLTHSCSCHKVVFDSSRDSFPALKGKERYRTRGYREIAHVTGCTDSSFRITTNRLNRVRRQPGATPVKFIQEGAEREGKKIAQELRAQSASILAQNCFKPRNADK